jgi:OFA family oxalate/formate antiporter-like MFS transporter
VKRVTIASGVLLGIGFFLTAHSSSLTMLWLSAGVLVGLADGAGYLLTLSNCVKWFPERKGLISAFSIGAYGLGSLVLNSSIATCWPPLAWNRPS